MDMSFLRTMTHYGNPIEVGGYNLIPISKSLQIRPRGFPAGLRWERPVGVLVRNIEGQEHVLPIQDVTRKVQVAVFLLAASGWLFLRRQGRK